MLNVAVCGLGWWGRIIVPLLKTSKKLNVVLGVDPVATMDGIPIEKDFDKALRHPEVQGVVLCTPHTLHTEQIVKAANAKKHVFCEKPLSMSRADVLKAIQKTDSNGVVLAVGHEKRFEPPIQELFRILQSGEIGVPLQVEANFSQDKGKEAPAGPMTATGIHLLDLSIGVFGPAKRVFSPVKQLGSQLTNGDTLAILVDFGKGHALLSAVLATPFDGRFAVYGSKGWVEVRDKAHPEAPEGWVLTRNIRGKKLEMIEYPPAKAVLANLEAFADAATGGARYPVPQEQMIANVSALEAIFKSAKSGNVEEVAA